MDYLVNCHTVYVGETKVTNKGIAKLSNCKIVDISDTKTTSQGIKKLSKCDKVFAIGIKKIKELSKTQKNIILSYP